MAEKVTLTTPVADYEVSALDLQWTARRIVITLVNSRGDTFLHEILDPQATTLMVALNKANLTANSLHRRIMQQLITDGVIAGTISGAPD